MKESLGISLQHSVQLVSQVIKHVADVIQNISCCLHCAAATVKQTGLCYKQSSMYSQVLLTNCAGKQVM